jgi:putative membrane protein insertion efficiency factor
MKYPLLWLIRAYQIVLSPMLPPSCRFEPSCSHYGYEAIQKHGAIKGTCLAVWRVLRCNPWGKGGYDPVP